ncbi:MAG: hypothetical protein F6J86_43890 [Symploca sp. SIO1B1]|nr:hypothetical protein [Symploca sp. SIO2D2]NEQ67759.1 hypothetical protein [Symploca sp. SIO2D2]NER25213.1 hypothetical protein [Symploca sp. SIO1C2]NES00649.1 hypothetical protein [Symploca sp. SIO1B1]
MTILPRFLRSLALTTLLSFVTPIVLVTMLLTAISVVTFVPGLQIIGNTGTTHLLDFLAAFGKGSSLEGVLVISLTFSLVGALFDTYAFYHYRIFNS